MSCKYCGGRGLVEAETLCPECNGSGTEYPALPPAPSGKKKGGKR